MKRNLMRVVAILALAILAPGLWAQEEYIGKTFKKPDVAEEARLRELLARETPNKYQKW